MSLKPVRVQVRTIWITGLSASGKSTIAEGLFKFLKDKKIIENVKLLDGEEQRKYMVHNFGFSVEERLSACKELIQITKKFCEEGYLTIVSTISYSREMKTIARKELPGYFEVYMKCSAKVCSKRDSKGQYIKALRGEYPMFVGVTHPYEPSDNPEMIIDSEHNSIEDCEKLLIDKVVDLLDLG